MICFMNDNPKFYKVVEVDGAKIATIKAKTHADEAEIQERCFHRKMINGKMTMDIDFERINIIRIRQALTGDQKCGWESQRPITEENISLLDPVIWNALLTAVNEIDKSWQDEHLSKNLGSLSDSSLTTAEQI